jgi:hypothetical protein
VSERRCQGLRASPMGLRNGTGPKHPAKRMAGENNQNKSLIGKSQNLLDLDVKRAAGKEMASENQSLEVQSKPIFDPFSSEPSSPTTLLVAQDDSACRTDKTSELSHH